MKTAFTPTAAAEYSRPTRRGFLSVLGLSAGAAAVSPLVDLDRLLWEPGRRLISLPAIMQAGENRIMSANEVTAQIWMMWREKGWLDEQQKRNDYHLFFTAPSTPRIGSPVNVRRPRRFTVTAHV